MGNECIVPDPDPQTGVCGPPVQIGLTGPVARDESHLSSKMRTSKTGVMERDQNAKPDVVARA